MLESLVIKLKASNFIKKETLTQTFSCDICEIFKNTYFQKYLLTTVSDFPNPPYPFSSLLAKFYVSISTEYKLGLFLLEQPFLIKCSRINYESVKKCFFNISINILIKILLKICALLKILFYTW